MVSSSCYLPDIAAIVVATARSSGNARGKLSRYRRTFPADSEGLAADISGTLIGRLADFHGDVIAPLTFTQPRKHSYNITPTHLFPLNHLQSTHHIEHGHHTHLWPVNQHHLPLRLPTRRHTPMRPLPQSTKMSLLLFPPGAAVQQAPPND